jgi:aminoglycoside phosphotransferase (APT) family kinase protein
VRHEDVVGFDPAAIEAWLPSVTDVEGPFTWHQLPGGHSNLTYEVADATGRRVVIRRPPEGQLLPKAHDMWREFRIIRALWPTPVPVAEPIAFAEAGLAATHFYVMGKVAGQALYNGAAVREWLDEPARQRAGESFIDVLAALHCVDPDQVGLGDLGRREGYVARQLKTWYGSWTASAAVADYDDERIHRLHDQLLDRQPEQGPARVVHGDYGPHNCLFAKSGDLTAVLDWEIATLGDPLADFAYALNAWAEPADPVLPGQDPATAVPGFPRRAELADRYAATTGADVTVLPYYRAFNYFKTACIIHGVYARYRAGQKSTEGVDLDLLRDRIAVAVDLADELASEPR